MDSPWADHSHGDSSSDREWADQPCQPDDYEELAARARERWTSIQRIKALQLSELQKALAAVPDVLAAPEPMVPWTPPGGDVRCPSCGMGQFYIQEGGYVTVNGILHRWRGRCCLCSKVVCYDLGEQGWAER